MRPIGRLIVAAALTAATVPALADSMPPDIAEKIAAMGRVIAPPSDGSLTYAIMEFVKMGK